MLGRKVLSPQPPHCYPKPSPQLLILHHRYRCTEQNNIKPLLALVQEAAHTETKRRFTLSSYISTLQFYFFIKNVYLFQI